jgi:hypothetical protein
LARLFSLFSLIFLFSAPAALSTLAFGAGEEEDLRMHEPLSC